ncbi:TetR/AcrR family transcriptional regulator [Aeromicrobium sp. CF4.19]|uniref:TetR/AcrR family transcriptional regulator n=1 Tax=Aeromicrobium sp. CF4.19 TaxID=3373082 RepID=UPI003EE46B00
MPRLGLNPDHLALAGAELADESGFEAVTISRVARRVGVQPASLYSHVDGSADLRDRVAMLVLGEMADAATSAIAGRSGRDALGAFADSYRDYAHRHPGRYEASHRRTSPSPRTVDEGRRHSTLSAALLRGYAVPEPEHVHAIRLLGSTIHGFVTLEFTGGFAHSAPAAEVSWDRIVDALDHLLRTWPTSSTDV